MVEVIAAVVVVVKVVVRAAVVNVLVIDVLADVGLIVVVIVSRFVMSVSYSIDVPSSGMAVDLFMNALADIMISVLTIIGIEVMAGVTGSALEFLFSTPLEEFSRWAAFDCRAIAIFRSDRALQAWMPSYHV